ncbi:MAG: hypothetical protein DWQ08_11610 [Proteobacteria bacterium]|nr:MAG: hypothetical protein DWQ08_11610 [Pseudomonadota bacterium]
MSTIVFTSNHRRGRLVVNVSLSRLSGERCGLRLNGFEGNALRSVYLAASTPGRIVVVETAGLLPGALSPAAFAVCVGLLGIDSRFWLSTDLRRKRRLSASLRFLRGAQCCASSRLASVALMNGSEWDGIDRFFHGAGESPRSGTTVVIEVDELRSTGGVTVRCDDGEDGCTLLVRGIDDRFWRDVNRNYRRAPRRLDFLLTCRNRMVAITRRCFVSTRSF